MRRLTSTNSFTSVGAGQTATLDLPVGDVIYHGLNIHYGTATAGGANQTNIEAEITNVRLKINGKVQRRFSAAQLNAIYAIPGKAFQTGLIPIFFSEPWRRTAQGEDALAWGMADVNTFQIEVDIDAGAASPTLSVVAEVEDGRRALGPIVKWRSFRQPVSATGVVQTLTLPKQDGYYKVHAFETADGDITDVEVTRDSREVIKASRTQYENYLANKGLTPQTALFSLQFDATKRLADLVPMVVGTGAQARRVSEWRFDWTMGAANSFDIVTEVIGTAD